MILEVAILNVRAGSSAAFQSSFAEAAPLIAGSPGYLSHELRRCIEADGRYLLLVEWETLEAHTTGFRGSAAYQQWKSLLHHYYDPFPTVEHYVPVQEPLMPDAKWELLTTTQDVPAAHVIAGLLEGSGISCQIRSDTALLGEARMCRVMVESPHLLAAQALLSGAEFTDAELDFLATGTHSCEDAKERE